MYRKSKFIKHFKCLRWFCSILFYNFFMTLSLFFKKRHDVVVFGALSYDSYRGNSKALFEFLQTNDCSVNAVWLCTNKKTYNAIKAAGYSAFFIYSPKGLYYYLVAGQFVVSSIFSYIIPFRRRIIQLWHGVPLKKIVYDDCKSKFRLKKNSLIQRLQVGFYDYFLALSDTNVNQIKSAFGDNAKNIVISGYPANDQFFETSIKSSGKRCIYAPTFRDNNSDLLENLNKLFNSSLPEFLVDENIELLIKLHPYSRLDNMTLNKLNKHPNLRLVNADVDINSILKDCDVLITDYSSVFIDFLLLDRPIVFLVFDLEMYLKERDFYYEYSEIIPGPEAVSWDIVEQYLKEVFSGVDSFKEKRKKIRNYFHYYQDGSSCKRVVDILLRG